jgi:energy-converting hydrogenase Eha subunit A
MNFLSGYKTYLVALASIAATIVGLVNGTIDIPQAIEAFTASTIFATLRHAAASNAGTAVISFLGGYKTYLAAFSAVAAALAAYATGNSGLVDTMQIIITAVMGVFLRTGMKQVSP